NGVIDARHRGEVAQRRDRRSIARLAKEADHALFGITVVEPLEAGAIEVDLVERWFLAIDAIEVGYPALHTRVFGILQHPPLERLLVRPFAAQSEFAAHEQQLLPRMRPHVAEKQTQVGKLLPGVPGHLAEQRALAVDDFVVRERKHEILAERIPEGKTQPV